MHACFSGRSVEELSKMGIPSKLLSGMDGVPLKVVYPSINTVDVSLLGREVSSCCHCFEADLLTVQTSGWWQYVLYGCSFHLGYQTIFRRCGLQVRRSSDAHKGQVSRCHNDFVRATSTEISVLLSLSDDHLLVPIDQ